MCSSKFNDNEMAQILLGKDLSPFLPHAPFVLSSRRDHGWLLGARRVYLDCNEVLSLVGAPNAVGIPCLERLLADGRAQVDLQPCALSLRLCYAQAVIQPRRRAGAFLAVARALFMFPILSSKSMKR